jgi:hypothetical protein
MNAKKWLQVIGGGLMLSAIYGGRSQVKFHFDEKEFWIGALIFASSFLTWKRYRNDGN